MTLFNYILWDFNPDLFTIPGLDHAVRWYGLLFALAFLFGQQIFFHIFKKEGQPEKDVEKLTVYMVLATVIGARLGHVLFYEPEKYLPHPLDIFKIWEGGLASHGAAAGILFAIYLYCRKNKKKGQTYLWTLDRIVIIVALAGFFIRMGNFMNSEILGKPTDSNYGVVFTRSSAQGLEYFSRGAIESVEVEENKGQKSSNQKNDLTTSPLSTEKNLVPLTLKATFADPKYTEKDVKNYLDDRVSNWFKEENYITENLTIDPNQSLEYSLSRNNQGQIVANLKVYGIVRHAAQLYESLSCLLLFFILFAAWNRKRKDLPQGLLLGIFLIYIFGLRFFYEFLKENQVAFENNLPLNMGQWLSIPLVIAGIFLVLRAVKKEPDIKS
ncbi:prolipoprotein diacylglyceryl transferase [Xanthovirga aplysinae]|uniref:prolipoprotein diacylglyceryl transferase n=1 Tax=Xanthovirga aplysinae TaxID=2529853 RepID=UPI0012BD3522|nr:prolipoprotein diacylglyceryl transferase [Xanthovirga aplysinae]MTI31000.1 prolipoprotein diacylglyceryl transferase [Xanthovirga aplysinae]